jgi:hypothetical protein
VIPTLRRSRDEIFLIGEEQILAEPEASRNPDPTIAIEAPGGRSSRRSPRSSHLHGSLQGARGLALSGLGAGAVALLAVLELGGGKGPAHPQAISSPRSPLISRSAAGVPAEPTTTRVHAPVAGPAEVPRPTVQDHHQHRPRHAEHQVSDRPPFTESEPEREPTLPVAPVSSPAVTPTEPTPEPEEASLAAATSTSPGPPPSSSGRGPAGVESFGFER